MDMNPFLVMKIKPHCTKFHVLEGTLNTGLTVVHTLYNRVSLVSDKITSITGLVIHYHCPVLRSSDSYLLIPATFGAVFFSSTGDFLSLALDIAGPPMQDLLINALASPFYIWALCSMMDSLEYGRHKGGMLSNYEVIKSCVAAFGFTLHFGESIWQLVDSSIKQILPVTFKK